jgi:hypothetical protein
MNEKKEKWTPHVIAIIVFGVFIVLGLACYTAPGPRYFDKSIPMEQSSTLILDGASGEGWNGWPLRLSKFDDNSFHTGIDEITIFIPAGRHTLKGFQVTNINTGGMVTSDSSPRGDGTVTRTTSQGFSQKIIHDIGGTFDFEPGKIYKVSTIPIPVKMTNKASIFSDSAGNLYYNKYDAILVMEGGFYLWEIVVNEVDEKTGNIIRNIPNNRAGSYLGLGIGFSAIGEYDTAIKYFDLAIQMNPNSSDWYTERGDMYHLKKDYDRALEDYNQAIKLDPKGSWTFNQRGLFYMDRNEYDRAIEDFNQAIKLLPNFEYYYNNRGYVYYLKKDYDNAIKDYKAALKIDRKYTEAQKNLEEAQKAKKERK